MQGSTISFTFILLDLCKAFDSNDHGFFLGELEKKLSQDFFLKWFESVLKTPSVCSGN